MLYVLESAMPLERLSDSRAIQPTLASIVKPLPYPGSPTETKQIVRKREH